MANARRGLSGAASGAGTGATIGSVIPGVGTTIGAGAGAVIGGLAGLFGGGGSKKPQSSAGSQQLSQLVATLRDRDATLRSQSPTSTASYNAGRGQLLDFIRRQTRTDASQAAQRGLAGTEFEIAQASRRQGLQADQERQLLASSERQLTAQQEASLARLLQSLGLMTQVEGQDQRRQDAQNAQLSNTFGQVAQSLPQIIGAFRQPKAAA